MVLPGPTVKGILKGQGVMEDQLPQANVTSTHNSVMLLTQSHRKTRFLLVLICLKV